MAFLTVYLVRNTSSETNSQRKEDLLPSYVWLGMEQSVGSNDIDSTAENSQILKVCSILNCLNF